MALKPCKECGKEISTEAKTCPNCGRKNPTGRMGFLTIIFWGVVVLIIIGIVAGQLGEKKDTSKSSKEAVVKSAPKKTDLQIVNEIEDRVRNYQKKMKEYYPTDDMFKTINEDSLKLVIIEEGYKKPNNEDQKKLLAKAKALRPKLRILIREVFAKNLERQFLDKGFNAEINAKGSNKEILEYKYALMSKALAYKLVNEEVTITAARGMGFKEIVFMDGFDKSWRYDLKEKAKN